MGVSSGVDGPGAPDGFSWTVAHLRLASAVVLVSLTLIQDIVPSQWAFRKERCQTLFQELRHRVTGLLRRP